MKRLALVPLIAFLAMAGDKEEGVLPYVTLAGAHSGIDPVDYRRIMTQDDLTVAWRQHRGMDLAKPYSDFHNEAGVPVVDFSRCMVVAVFAGRTTNAVGVYPVSIVETEDRVLVRFAVRSYQSGPEADRVTPFGFFILPRSDKTLVLEQGFYSLGGAPPRWKEQARFPALER